MDIALAIHTLIPEADYQGSLTPGTREAFDEIRWNDARQKPTWEELQAVTLPAPVEPITPAEVVDALADRDAGKPAKWDQLKQRRSAARGGS